jgi:carboxylesterase type B
VGGGKRFCKQKKEKKDRSKIERKKERRRRKTQGDWKSRGRRGRGETVEAWEKTTKAVYGLVICSSRTCITREKRERKGEEEKIKRIPIQEYKVLVKHNIFCIVFLFNKQNTSNCITFPM